jgi:hypothetical protein
MGRTGMKSKRHATTRRAVHRENHEIRGSLGPALRAAVVQ